MKPINWIMSKVLSPGAYAVWHSMGNPEEWVQHTDDTLMHKTTGLSIFALDKSTDQVPSLLAYPVVFLIGSFFVDCKEPYKGAIGYLERHLIAGRVFRTLNSVKQHERKTERQKRNQAVFTRLLVNQEVQ